APAVSWLQGCLFPCEDSRRLGRLDPSGCHPRSITEESLMNTMTHLDRKETTFATYKDRYKSIRLSREDGILEMHLHTDGGPLRWSLLAHNELEDAFLEIGRDRANDVIIMTGTGDEFCGP